MPAEFRCTRCDDVLDVDAKWCDSCSMDLFDRDEYDDGMTAAEAAGLERNLIDEFGPQTSLKDDMAKHMKRRLG